MTPQRHLTRWLLATAVALAATACAAPEPVPEPDVAPAPTQPELAAPEPPPASTRELVRLANGMTCYVEAAPNGSPAEIQFGVLGGTLLGSSGAAELASQVLVESSDPNTGRPTLRRAIARLGGTLDVHLGLTSTWFELRLPAARVAEALTGLRAALESGTDSRNQIERMRTDLVARRAREIAGAPTTAMTEALLQAEPSSGAYLESLRDLDVSEAALFRSRFYRPPGAVLLVRMPRPTAAIAALLNDDDDGRGIAGWRPAPPLPGTAGLRDTRFEDGLYWAETDSRGQRTRTSIVLQLPDATNPGAADWLMMHACLTLDGTGGRLELLQEQAGLSHVVWQARLHRTGDQLAIELSSETTADEAVRLWQLYRTARQSLRDVPPNASERALAARRAQLTARLQGLDEGAGLRRRATMALRGMRPDALAQRLAAIADNDAWVPEKAFEAFAKSPAWMVAIGAKAPESTDVRAIELLPAGFTTSGRDVPTPDTLRAAKPWLKAAIAATGGNEWLRRLDGFTTKTRTIADRAPEASDEITWQRDGELTRRRTLLGAEIVTTLHGDGGQEQLDGRRRALPDAVVARLRQDMSRHPLMLLAAAAQGRLTFRSIAERSFDDRELMVLEAVDGGHDRLRVHIDTESHLIRIVECWQTLDDDSRVHIRERWSDYRQAGALRVPRRLRTSWNDGERQQETRYETFVATFDDADN